MDYAAIKSALLKHIKRKRTKGTDNLIILMNHLTDALASTN